jgi:hypothetical protein
VYYRLEREVFKEKAFMVIKYHDESEIVVYASKRNPRPNRYSTEINLQSPKMVPFNNTHFEQRHLYVAFHTSKILKIKYK